MYCRVEVISHIIISMVMKNVRLVFYSYILRQARPVRFMLYSLYLQTVSLLTPKEKRLTLISVTYITLIQIMSLNGVAGV